MTFGAWDWDRNGQWGKRMSSVNGEGREEVGEEQTGGEVIWNLLGQISSLLVKRCRRGWSRMFRRG